MNNVVAVCSQAAALAPVFAQEREAEEDLLPLSQFWEGTKTEATIIGQSNNNSNTGSPHPSGYEHQSLDSTAMQPHAWTFDSPVDTHYECAANNSKHQPALPKEQPSPVCESYRAKSLAGTNGYMVSISVFCVSILLQFCPLLVRGLLSCIILLYAILHRRPLKW